MRFRCGKLSAIFLSIGIHNLCRPFWIGIGVAFTEERREELGVVFDDDLFLRGVCRSSDNEFTEFLESLSDSDDKITFLRDFLCDWSFDLWMVLFLCDFLCDWSFDLWMVLSDVDASVIQFSHLSQESRMAFNMMSRNLDGSHGD